MDQAFRTPGRMRGFQCCSNVAFIRRRYAKSVLGGEGMALRRIGTFSRLWRTHVSSMSSMSSVSDDAKEPVIVHAAGHCASHAAKDRYARRRDKRESKRCRM